MRQRPELRWWIVSVAAHAAMLALVAWAVGHPGMIPWYVGEVRERADTVMIMWPDDEPVQGAPVRTQRTQRTEAATIAPLPPAGVAMAAVPSLRDTFFAALDVAQQEGDALPPVSVTPGYGDGRLWVRPGTVLSRGAPGGTGEGVGDVSGPLDVAAHVASIDSALAVRILAFLDTLPPDSFAYNMRPPSWTTEVDGRTWGIDQNWIYLGDLKLPTILLGLLPFPGQGNYELGQRNASLQRIREDILRAAARASDAADFRRYVNELRERREAERRQDHQN